MDRRVCLVFHVCRFKVQFYNAEVLVVAPLRASSTRGEGLLKLEHPDNGALTNLQPVTKIKSRQDVGILIIVSHYRSHYVLRNHGLSHSSSSKRA